MTPKKQLLITYHSNSRNACEILRQQGFSPQIDESVIWQSLIYEYDCFDNPTDIIFKKLTTEEIVSIVSKNILRVIPLYEIIVEKSILPDNFNRTLIKAELRFKGEKWVIHKWDKDFFPSSPHAHNYEKNVTLHLGNGSFYEKRIKQGQINKKDFINLGNLIQPKILPVMLPTLEV